MLSLVAAIVLFSVLESYAIVEEASYRLGGAVAGFVVVFGVLVGSYSRLIAKPASNIIKESAKLIKKPKGFKEFNSPERDFSLYYPKNWKVKTTLSAPPLIFFDAKDKNAGSLVITENEVAKDAFSKIEKDSTVITDGVAKSNAEVYKNYKFLKEGTIALHGKQCPTILGEIELDNHKHLLYQIVIPSRENKKVYVITWGSKVENFESAKPTFQKITSTFHSTN